MEVIGESRAWRSATWSWALVRRGRFKGGGAELAQHVTGAAREFARDRQRGARVAEPAGLEREVVGVVGAARSARCERGLVERPAQMWRALTVELADARAAV